MKTKTELGVVETLLNNLRATKGVSREQVAKESDRVYKTALMTGQVCGHIFMGVPLELIHIDSGYQRTGTFNKAKGNQIAAEFSEAVYEPIKLNYRDGAFYCPSGQHRIYAHLKMEREFIISELISCSREEEIAIFLYQDDNRSKLSPYDRWKAGVALGYEEDVALQEICEQYRLQIGKVQGKARLGSITTARHIIEKYGKEMLSFIFDTIEKAGWHDEPKAWDSRIVRSLYKLYTTRSYSIQDSRDKLLRFLKGKTPQEVYANALLAYPTDLESALLDLFTDIVSGKRRGKAV